MSYKKTSRRQKIRMRIRKRVNGTNERPRLSVFRSNKQIYAQLVDDVTGHTLAAASSREEGIFEQSGNKVDQSKLVGQLIAKKAVAAGISKVVFDRGGYLYHGRVKSLADGARDGGLQF
jgi:large subunit ribosomal protein L18